MRGEKQQGEGWGETKKKHARAQAPFIVRARACEKRDRARETRQRCGWPPLCGAIKNNMGAPAIGFVDMVANTPLAAATLFAVALHFALVGVCAYVCMRVCVCVCVFVCVSDLKCLLPLLNAASSLVFLQSGRSDARHWNTESIVLCVLC